jgi:predicted phosphodiesterase
MSVYGIIADVHGNLEALRSVLAALDARGVERVLCLGDIVGYNAEANECVELLRARGVEAIAGNHDLIALGRLGFERCADRPAFALRRTRRTLSASSREFLAALPPRRSYHAGTTVLIHGGVVDACQYLTTPARLLENCALLRQHYPAVRVCWFGHTHVQKLYEVGRDTVSERAPDERLALAAEDCVYFVNPGSVDAARKALLGVAEFAIYDAAAGVVWFGAAPYDHGCAERSAVRGGYRMSRLDAWLYRGLGLLRRGQSVGRRHLARVLRPLGRPDETPC